MSPVDIQKKAIEILSSVSVAVTQIRLYPSASAIIRNTIDRLHQHFTDLLNIESSLVLEKSEKNTIICGHFFTEKDWKRHPQVVTFLNIMTLLGIRSVSFEKGLGKPELRTFLEIINKAPEEVEEKGGLSQLITRETTPNILVDHKRYRVVGIETVDDGNAAHPNPSGVIPSKRGEPPSSGRAAAEALPKESPEIHHQPARKVSPVDQDLLSEDRIEPLLRVLPEQLNRIRTEAVGPAGVHERTLQELRELSQKLILNDRIPDAIPVLEMLNHLYTGQIETSDTIRKTAGEALGETASGPVLKRILAEFHTPGSVRRKAAAICLTLLGDFSVSRLLDQLRQSSDMPERITILQAVCEIGEPATWVLEREIEAGGPQSYLRYLIHMLGKIGREDHLRVLIPLLKHEDFRIQWEALMAVYHIGGDYRGDLLLSAFPSAEEPLQIAIVDMLGALRHQEAVPVLVELLERDSVSSPSSGEKMKEKVCSALGRIGSRQAIPALRAIALSKGLPGVDPPSESLLSAALNAVRDIENISSPGSSSRAYLHPDGMLRKIS